MNNQDQNLEKQLMELGKEEKKIKRGTEYIELGIRSI